MVLCILDELIQPHCYDAENQDTGNDKVELEYLTSIDNQITKSSAGGKKFADNNAYQSEPYVDLHGA